MYGLTTEALWDANPTISFYIGHRAGEDMRVGTILVIPSPPP